MVGKKSENKAVGRTKGGINTKIHAIVDGLGNPVAFLLSPGNDGDSTHAVDLMSKIDIEGSNLLGDKAYGTKEILAYIKEHGAVAVIPPKINAKKPWKVDYNLKITGFNFCLSRDFLSRGLLFDAYDKSGFLEGTMKFK